MPTFILASLPPTRSDLTAACATGRARLVPLGRCPVPPESAASVV